MKHGATHADRESSKFYDKNDLEAVKFEQKKLREILMANQHELSGECNVATSRI